MADLEFQFGDERLNMRAEHCFSMLRQDPGVSFPQAFKSSGELQGFYRFIHNPKVEVEELKRSIVDQTRSHIGERKKVLALHDTTHVRPTPKAESIEEFKQSKGFFVHLSLLIDAANTKQIFGMGAAQLWSRRGKKQRGETGESQRWFDQVKSVEDDFGDLSIIHVMDREADAYPRLSQLIENQYSFVIRMNYDRQVTDEVGDISRIREEIKKTSSVETRDIQVSSRKKALHPRSRKSHPARNTRSASVNIAAKSMFVHRSDRRGNITDERIKLNVVRVFEESQPAGEDAIEWLLLTTEPIDTKAQIMSIVEIYKSRWAIEEFFKGLKSGCNFEERLLGDVGSWHKLFLLFLPITVDILNLRIMGDAEIKGSRILSPTQVKILNIQTQNNNARIKSVLDAKLQIARLGGHIAANGNPGWITLLRGYKQLLFLEQGWLLAQNEKM
jgi:hypothetical protein